jgi:copper transporter 1
MAAIQRRHGGAYIVDSKPSTRRPWRADEAVVLASMDVVLAGLGYLLSVSKTRQSCLVANHLCRMVAVMTMNVGYLISILAGVFVGTLIFGRFMAYSVAH